MRACSGRLPAEEPGPLSGPLPGGGGTAARGEEGEREHRERERMDACKAKRAE